MAAPTSFPSTGSKGTSSLPMMSIDASFRGSTVTAISRPMKELPITMSFFPSFAAINTVGNHRKAECGRGEVTCIDLYGVTNAAESENVLEVSTGNGKPLGLASRSKDELVVVNKLFTSFQNYLLSDDVDGGDGLIIYSLFAHGVTN
jgi:hypothetical protein